MRIISIGRKHAVPTDPGRRRLLRAVGWAAAAGLASVPVAAPARLLSRRHLYTFPLPPDGGRVIGRPHVAVTRPGDTLFDVARRFDVGYWDIVLANPGVDFWLPGAGTPVIIPRHYLLPDTPREGIVINVPELRLYYYPAGPDGRPDRVITHPVGVGRRDWGTPFGVATVIDKIPEPTWYPPASIRAEAAANGERLPGVVPPGPDNPLGAYALILDLPGYLLHGTNRPAGVGMRVSHGCVRLYPEDIAELFPQVPRGTPVRIVNQPDKLAWDRGRLLIELHPLPSRDDYTTIDPDPHRAMFDSLRHRVADTARKRGRHVDPMALRRLTRGFTGLPQAVPGVGHSV